MYIRLKKSDFDSIPKIYLYDGSTELTDPFPGNNMAEVGNYYVYTHENIESATPTAKKILRNGQLLIIYNGKIYGVDGKEIGK